MAIFYTLGNSNIKTIELVAKSVWELSKKNNYQIEKIVIFNTELSRKYHEKQVILYRKYFCNITVEEVIIHEYDWKQNNKMLEVFKEKNIRIIDLTNGPKVLTTLLYLYSLFINETNIYQISLKLPIEKLPDVPLKYEHYDYVKISKNIDLQGLARIGYIDLVRYIEEIQDLLEDREQNIYEDLSYGVTEFFGKSSNRSAVSNITTFVEIAIVIIFEYLKEYKPAVEFSKENGIEFQQKDPVGAIQYFFKKYSLKERKDINLKKLITVSYLLSALRNYRNLSAHSGKIDYLFSENEVRIVLNMTIELLKILKSNSIIWKKFKNTYKEI